MAIIPTADTTPAIIPASVPRGMPDLCDAESVVDGVAVGVGVDALEVNRVSAHDIKGKEFENMF